MTPGARLAAAIQLLDEITASSGAADDVAAFFFRGRRFVGSHDRRAINTLVHAVLRHRGRLDWWLARVGLGSAAQSPSRSRALVALRLLPLWGEPGTHPLTPEELARCCDGTGHAPRPLEAEERTALVELGSARLPGAGSARLPGAGALTHPEQPLHVRCGFLEWLTPHLERAFGETLEKELRALDTSAPLDLRVNTLRAEPGESVEKLRQRARRTLADAGIDAAPTPHSPVGLRVQGRPSLHAVPAFETGLIEVQDEGSQLLAFLLGAREGERLVDFCAGAGGKTLALAAILRNTGRIIASDVSEARLGRAAKRLRRAGAHDWEKRVLSSESDPWVKRHAGRFDRVFVDAPCTGTGAWRRNPDSKWSLEPRDIDELTALQDRILASAARLVRPGGVLLHATCSVLVEENEDRVEAFLAARRDFQVVPQEEAWKDALGTASPVRGTFLRLTPAAHGTDGFFAAVLRRDG